MSYQNKNLFSLISVTMAFMTTLSTRAVKKAQKKSREPRQNLPWDFSYGGVAAWLAN
jgi:hypothetical protein